MEQGQTYYENNEEITLKELIQIIKKLWAEVWLNRKLVIIVSILLGASLFIKTLIAPVTYTAELTFMVNEDEGGGSGALNSILGTFGFGGTTSEHNFEKILTLSKSRRIIGRSIFEKAKINGREDYLANHIIGIYGLHEQWEDSENGLKDFFFTSSDQQNFSVIENVVLKTIIGNIVGNVDRGVDGLFLNSYNEDTGIMSLTVTSLSETLSIQLVKSIYKKLSVFYIDKTVERQQKAFDVTKTKVDSLNRLLNLKESEYLKYQDSYRQLSLKQYESQKVKLERNLRVLTIAYGEALKNLEISDFGLKNATPFFQEIDSPISPLKPSFAILSLIKNLIIGSILGGIFSVFWITVRKIYRDAMI